MYKWWLTCFIIGTPKHVFNNEINLVLYSNMFVNRVAVRAQKSILIFISGLDICSHIQIVQTASENPVSWDPKISQLYDL